MSLRPTPDTCRSYPGTIAAALRNDMINFFNPNDYALATGTYAGQNVHWEQDQLDYKPDSGFDYGYNGTLSYHLHPDGPYTVTDPHELMAFVSRPRSKAIGTLSGVGGEIHGAEVNLNASFGFNNAKDEHSAQFNWNIQRLWSFYQQLGISLGILAP